MSEVSAFVNNKVTLAIGLLVILLTLSPSYPILERQEVFVGDSTYLLSYGYLMVSASLGLSIYCYSCAYIGGRDSGRIVKAGDFLYLVSMALVPATIVTYALGWIQTKTVGRLTHGVATIVASVMVLAVVLVAWKYSARMRVDENTIKKRVENTKAEFTLSRAVDLLSTGHHDLAVLEAFRSLETALRNKLSDAGIGTNKMLPALMEIANERKILGPEILAPLKEARTIRNSAAHSTTPISFFDADFTVKAVERALNALSADTP